MRTRRFQAGDGALLRDLRLRALKEAPFAFASTYAEEADRPPEAWEERARADARSDTGAGFFAFDADRPVGMVRAYFDAEEGEPDVVHLISMWVDPAARVHGAGRALTQAVLGWARGRKARLVKLWVTTTNDPAVRLYERCAFRRTEIIQPLPSDPTLRIVRMERAP